MNLRAFFYLAISTSLLAILLLFIAWNFTSDELENQKLLSYNAVRGMAIGTNDSLQTLNFEQQNQMIRILRKYQKNDKYFFEDYSQVNLFLDREFNDFIYAICPKPIKKLVIYRFDGPDYELMAEN